MTLYPCLCQALCFYLRTQKTTTKGLPEQSFSCYTPLTHHLQTQRKQGKYMHRWPEYHLFLSTVSKKKNLIRQWNDLIFIFEDYLCLLQLILHALVDQHLFNAHAIHSLLNRHSLGMIKTTCGPIACHISHLNNVSWVEITVQSCYGDNGQWAAGRLDRLAVLVLIGA